MRAGSAMLCAVVDREVNFACVSARAAYAGHGRCTRGSKRRFSRRRASVERAVNEFRPEFGSRERNGGLP